MRPNLLAGLCGSNYPPGPFSLSDLFRILPNDATLPWTGGKTAALTCSIDSSVLWGGQPTIRVDIPANTTGVIRVGNSNALAPVPAAWIASQNTGQFCMAVKVSEDIPTLGLNLFIGESGLSKYWSFSLGLGAATDGARLHVMTEWIVCTPEDTNGTGLNWGKTSGGSAPTMGTNMQVRISWTMPDIANQVSIWFGVFGMLPPKRPAIMIWFDDGYTAQYDLCLPVLKAYNIPATFSIIRDTLGGGGYMTVAKAVEIANDPSGLFCVCNHSIDSGGYNARGAATMYSNFVTNRTYLQGIGCPADGTNIIAYPSGEVGSDLTSLLEADGAFLCARTGGNPLYDRRNQLMAWSDKIRWLLGPTTFPTSSVTEASVETLINSNNAAQVDSIFGFHDIKVSATGSSWWLDRFTQLCAYIAGLRANGTADPMNALTFFRHVAGSGPFYSYK